MFKFAQRKSLNIAKLHHAICRRGLAQTINADDSGYEAVPHYKENSALFIARPDHSPFPNIISPDTDFDRTFQPENMLKSSLNVNLTARYGRLNLIKLKEDYIRMRGLEDRIEVLNQENKLSSAKINKIVKEKGLANRKVTMDSAEVRDLISSGTKRKEEIAKIEQELLPLKEIVTTACLRLPNSLHYSTLFIHNYQQNKSTAKKDEDTFKNVQDTEDCSKMTLFEFNNESMERVKNKVTILNSENHWKKLLNDSIIVDSKLVKPSYAANLDDNWSFAEQSSNDLNSRYLVGAYAKLERALVDYMQEKISSLGCFEHIKSASMFKSAIVEGCGQSFYDPANTLNVVRFHSTSGHKSQPPKQKGQTNIELLHLTGSSSIQALVLNFVRASISSKHLPWGVFTNGTTLTPKKGQRNTYDVLIQCADKSALVLENDSPSASLNETYLDSILTNGKAYLNEIKSQLSTFLNAQNENIGDLNSNKNIDTIFVDLCKMFVYIYKDFGLPIRFVCLNANELKQAESFKIEVQAYLPSEQNFTTVSNFSENCCYPTFN
jgi:seryl-tRNA synthetase